MPCTLFVSDLHLDAGHPAAEQLFQQLLGGRARHADALYILGDLFEAWIGVDYDSLRGERLCDALKNCTTSGVPVFIMHGNRDFLLQDGYAKLAGMELLPEEHVIDLYGEKVLLMHGDSLCTDDIAYQQLRTVVRNPAWQAGTLSRSPQERLQMALELRDASAEHKGSEAMSIMDVNQDAVISAFERHGILRMIHGHTHRPATHDLQVNCQKAQRIVLGDWYTQGSVLRVSPEGYELSSL